MGFLLALKRKAHGQQHVSQLLNSDPALSARVLDALLWSAEYDGIPITDELVDRAMEEGMKYPSLTVTGYLEGIRNRLLKNDLLGDLAMFGNIKDSWKLAKIGAAIEGVVRESRNGNATMVMQWYSDFLIDSQEYGKRNRLSPSAVFEKAARFTPSANCPAFREIVASLTKPGNLLYEIHRDLNRTGAN